MQNGLLIASLRNKYNLSQKELAKILNISRATYKNYEANITPIPLTKLNIISNLFNVSLDYLLGLSTKNKPIKKEINYNYLKYNLWFIRVKNHLNIKDLAKEFKITPQTINNYEKNSSSTSITYLYNIAKKLNISVDYMCGKNIIKEKTF